MSFAKMVKKSILFALLAVFVINQVSAKRCYACLSELDLECKTNPRQEKFETNCGSPEDSLFGNLRSSSYQHANHEIESNDVAPATVQCVTATYTNLTKGESFLARGCTQKFVADLSLKVVSVVREAIQIDKIRRCNTELCNKK